MEDGGSPDGKDSGTEITKGGGSKTRGTNGFGIVALSSGTVDCRFARLSSSSSSVISIRRRLRRELVEEDVDPEAVCNEQAADSVESFNSFEEVMEKVVS